MITNDIILLGISFPKEGLNIAITIIACSFILIAAGYIQYLTTTPSARKSLGDWWEVQWHTLVNLIGVGEWYKM